MLENIRGPYLVKSEYPVRRDFRIMGDEECEKKLLKISQYYKMGFTKKEIRDLFKEYQARMSKGKSIVGYYVRGHGKNEKEVNDNVRKLFKKFQASCLKYGSYLMSDLPVLVDNIVKNHSSIVRKYSCLYPIIGTDELQDLNSYSRRLLSSLGAAGSRLICFGDRRQTLYLFAGAKFNTFRKVQKSLKKECTKKYYLTKSYRLTPASSSFANSIADQVGFSKIRPTKGRNSSVENVKPLLIECQDGSDLIEKIVELIEKLIKKRRGNDKILVSSKTIRNNYDVIRLKKLFFDNGIDFIQSPIPKNTLNVISGIINTIKILEHPTNKYVVPEALENIFKIKNGRDLFNKLTSKINTTGISKKIRKFYSEIINASKKDLFKDKVDLLII